MRTAELEPISQWHEDFQVILCDLLWEIHPQAEWHSVSISSGNIRDHMEEWEENAAFWSTEDHERVDLYADSMKRGDEFPPLIANEPKSLLRDGYHRMGAYIKLGVYVVPFIYLNEQSYK